MTGSEIEAESDRDATSAADDDIDLPDPPWLTLTHYLRMLKAYRSRGEDGLEALEDALRAKAAAQPTGKFSKRQALYVPFVPLPPLDWRHKCGHCRFWVDHGPGKPGECMIVGREGNWWGGEKIHEKAGCALFTPPAGEPMFAWISEQMDPTGADLARGEYHRLPPEQRRNQTDGDDQPSEQVQRHPTELDVGTSVAPAGATVGLEPVAEGLAAPIEIEFDSSENRQLIADQAGVVYLQTAHGLRDEPLLDIRDRMVNLRTQYDERGLLGLALHPDFANNGRLFVRYSAPPREGTPDDYDHTSVLSEFRFNDGQAKIDPDSERAILEISHSRFNHNAGAIEFGPDGHLYVAMGDGGGEGGTGFGHVEGSNSQDITENLLGSVMRIDVDDERDEKNYAIPDDNPLVGEDGLDELYAWGLRNPWRMSFDSEDRLFVADVGQALFEEVNIVEKGGNYGWNIKEGTHCFDPENPQEPPEDCPDESRRGEPLIDPIIEYPHIHEDEVIGSAIIGGALYASDTIPDLQGKYVFGDWATSQDRPSGRLWAASPPEGGDGQWEMEELVVFERESGRPERNVLGFSRGPDGEFYLLSSESHVPKGTTGAVHKLVSPLRS